MSSFIGLFPSISFFLSSAARSQSITRTACRTTYYSLTTTDQKRKINACVRKTKLPTVKLQVNVKIRLHPLPLLTRKTIKRPITNKQQHAELFFLLWYTFFFYFSHERDCFSSMAHDQNLIIESLIVTPGT